MTTIPTTPQDVLDAMSSVHDEQDRWRLAESLVAAVPTGSERFGQIVDDAKAAGIPARFTANTLRLYRDTAVRWPEAKRVQHVTFSAHREAMVVGDVDEAKALLEGMVKTTGASAVTVSAVRKAIAAHQGKAPKTAKAKAEHVSLADLLQGGDKLIALIRAAAPGYDTASMDRLHGGLSRTLAEVEKLRAKKSKAAARKGQAPAPSTARKAAPAPSTRKPRKAAAGDLRNL